MGDIENETDEIIYLLQKQKGIKRSRDLDRGKGIYDEAE